MGESDGWQDLMQHKRMEWEYGSATGGNIAIIGELDLSSQTCDGLSGVNGRAKAGAAKDGRAVVEFTVAIGIGEGHHTAAQRALGSLTASYAELRSRFLEQWHRAANPEWLAAKAQDGGKLMRASHNVLLAHEDKTFSGAFVASASIPWGQVKTDEDMGGYHLVWTRDMVQTATAILACGRRETARRALMYLACTQQPDGGFAQNFWIDGTPYWSGKQLDEVAFPLILAWRLWKAGDIGELDIYSFVERAAGCLIRQAPITQQERWEENAGYSPSTLAVVVSGLICAAEMARACDFADLSQFLEEFADWIEGHLEDWTVTNNGVLDPEVKRHYMRIRPPECGEAYAHEDCGKEHLWLNNQPPGVQSEFEARQIIDAGFLELVRYGVRRADDPLMIDSLKVVDSQLKRKLPQGSGWLRYNHDGYGQQADGGPYIGWGQGRVWPLLTGERAHFELAAGRDIAPLISTYEAFATPGQMMPEQIWDAEDMPDCSMLKGQPAGAAVPLVWAHAEYLKLLRSALDGKVFDRIDAVYSRYCEPEGRKLVRHDLEIYARHRPIHHIDAGKTLRILDDNKFDVIWTADNWKTTGATSSRSFGGAGYSADVAPEAGCNVLEWTLHWTETDTWLGYNVKVKIDPAG